MAHQIRAWRNEARAWRRAMLKTPRPNTELPLSCDVYILSHLCVVVC